MHPVDLGVIAAYLLGILAIGGLFGRHQSRQEFFVASRSMGWFAVGLSVMATLFSSNSFVFYPAAALGDSLRIGLSLIAFTLMTPVVIWVFIPIYARLNLETAYEYLELRFHVSVRTLAAALFVLLRIGWMASATYAASIVVHSVSGLPQTGIIIGLGVFAIGYTMLGGLRAVMWTDVVQFFVFALTILATLLLVLHRTGLDLGAVIGNYFDGRDGMIVDFELSLTRSYGSWAILIGVFLESVSAFGVDQVAVQRYLSSRSERNSQIGAILNLTGSWIVVPGLLAIGVSLFSYFSLHPAELGAGTLAEILQNDPKVADQALPTFVRLHFPPGLAGLFLAALMAAIMSSIDSGIHSVTTVLVVDFRDRLIPRWRPQSARAELWSIRLAVLTIGAIAVTLACFVGVLGNVFDIGKKLTAAFGGPLLAMFLLALFSPRANTLGVLLGGIIATAWTLLLMYTETWFSVWYWPIGFSLTLGLGYSCSFLRPSRATDFTYRRILARSTQPRS